ncbi:putative methyltransferase NSUN6 [Diachasma alloeum]|uniref:putative methyltransferase NSUN6 n=1 Tax=Diachasma alloeum TaxID=454923 RepID=UPI0007383DD0|nr:putative methyltransferase NSUN6 [Diachasma alloeum]
MTDINKISTNTRKSFFKNSEEIERELKNDLRKIRINSGENIDEKAVHEKYEEMMNWLETAPKNTVLRSNSSFNSSDELIQILKKSCEHKNEDFNFSTFHKIPELIIVDKKRDSGVSGKSAIILYPKEAIVDAVCGSAVLRGAHVFAPGVMGLSSGSKIGDLVSVFADASGACKKGLSKQFLEEKKFLGNGILLQNRHSIFLDGGSGTGIAIRMTQTMSDVPQLVEEDIPRGSALLQNFPSIICSRILDPRPGDAVLDLCAAPGNKTTHLSSLMKDTGTLIALEKVKSKIERLQNHCRDFNCRNVRVFCVDSTKSVDSQEKTRKIEDGPPFSRGSFDRILLDGPCSVLGKRPQILNKINCKELRSFVPLQRKLFSAAVEVLKVGGILVYSTCTVTISENEGIVAWALKTFPSLELTSAREKYESFELGAFAVSPGYRIDGLTPDDAEKVLRFGPQSDSVGFFIASFRKR